MIWLNIVEANRTTGWGLINKYWANGQANKFSDTQNCI
jgi:hypothetical protein